MPALSTLGLGNIHKISDTYVPLMKLDVSHDELNVIADVEVLVSPVEVTEDEILELVVEELLINVTTDVLPLFVDTCAAFDILYAAEIEAPRLKDAYTYIPAVELRMEEMLLVVAMESVELPY